MIITNLDLLRSGFLDKIKSGYELATTGRFQIMILNDIPIGYPLDGPMKLILLTI